MKKSTILIISLFAILLSSCTYEPLVINSIGNMKFKSINNNIISVELTIDVDNPNDVPTKIKKIEFDLLTNGKLIGSLRNTEEQIFGSRSDGKYRIPLEIEVVDLVSGISNVLSYIKNSESVGNNLFVDGYISGVNGKIPFKKKVKSELAEIIK